MTTEQVEEPAETPALGEMEVPFTFVSALDGEQVKRTMWVRMPSHEKLLVWQRTVTALERVPVDATWNASEVMKALERLRKIVDSILVNKADVEWIDDQFLEGVLTFRTLAPMIITTVEAYKEMTSQMGNREDRRATKKATKKATRKKANS